MQARAFSTFKKFRWKIHRLCFNSSPCRGGLATVTAPGRCSHHHQDADQARCLKSDFVTRSGDYTKISTALHNESSNAEHGIWDQQKNWLCMISWLDTPVLPPNKLASACRFNKMFYCHPSCHQFYNGRNNINRIKKAIALQAHLRFCSSNSCSF